MILPGTTLGVLGGGQLGRMFTVAARTMGYHVLVLDPDPQSPAGAVADVHLCADYDDAEALSDLARRCAAVTTEFENVPAASLAELARHLPVRPDAEAVAVARDRIREKSLFRELGLATAPFAAVTERGELREAAAQLQRPAILKTAQLGYDGKGQAPVVEPDEAAAAFDSLGGVPCVLEERISLERELSVIVARGVDGRTAAYPVVENTHRNGILHTTVAPARIPEPIATQAVAMAQTIARRLEYCGVLAVEFFLTPEGELLVNEMAPRPHNSGHYTMDACATSQFEQQVRTLCGLPPGDTRQLSPAVMVNLLGDLWANGVPRWELLLSRPEVKLHLYGKREPRAGRKMGHFTCLGQDVAATLALAEELHAGLIS